MSTPQQRPRRAYVGTRQELGPEPPPEAAVPEVVVPAQATDPDPPPADGPATPPAPAPTADRWLRPGAAEDTVLAVAGRFDDPNAAAGYLGHLLDAAAARPTVHHGDTAWWVLADVRLTLARELIELSGGTPYVAAGDRLRQDRGWGPPPPAAGLPRPGDLPWTDLAELPIADLVVTAGLRRRPATPQASVTVLVPAARASALLHRAADLRLGAVFRPVRLQPLFTGPAGNGAGGGSLIQVRLQAGAAGSGHVPAALLHALDDGDQALVLREVTDDLLVQHDRQAPLSDRQLGALVDTATWVIADRPFGCWSLEPFGAFADAASLMALGPAHRLEPGDPAVAGAGQPAALPDPVPVTVVRSPRRNAPVDALLLRDSDLDAVRLILEGHPLADQAFIVPGRDHHLLIAGGGVAERVPLGWYLTSAAPQPVYLRHGWRTDPVLPPSVYAELAAQLPGHALVLEADRTLVFDLGLRRPVWELWAGPLPTVDLQLPDGAGDVLAEVDRAADPWGQVNPLPPVPPKAPGGRLRTAGRGMLERLRNLTDQVRGPVTWQQQALDAELDGQLRQAARLHEDNGSPLKAARLYERAAFGEPQS
jgi:hypothetical protein